MFDIGFFELLIIFVIALLVLGPERLPKAASSVGRWMGKAKSTVASFKADIDRELQLEEMRKKLDEQARQLQQASESLRNDANKLLNSHDNADSEQTRADTATSNDSEQTKIATTTTSDDNTTSSSKQT